MVTDSDHIRTLLQISSKTNADELVKDWVDVITSRSMLQGDKTRLERQCEILQQQLEDLKTEHAELQKKYERRGIVFAAAAERIASVYNTMAGSEPLFEDQEEQVEQTSTPKRKRGNSAQTTPARPQPAQSHLAHKLAPKAMLEPDEADQVLKAAYPLHYDSLGTNPLFGSEGETLMLQCATRKIDLSKPPHFLSHGAQFILDCKHGCPLLKEYLAEIVPPLCRGNKAQIMRFGRMFRQGGLKTTGEGHIGGEGMSLVGAALRDIQRNHVNVVARTEALDQYKLLRTRARCFAAWRGSSL